MNNIFILRIARLNLHHVHSYIYINMTGPEKTLQVKFVSLSTNSIKFLTVF